MNELAAIHQNASEDGTSRNSTLVVVSVCGGLKDFLVSQVKYNLPIIEKILEDEEAVTVSEEKTGTGRTISYGNADRNHVPDGWIFR